MRLKYRLKLHNNRSNSRIVRCVKTHWQFYPTLSDSFIRREQFWKNYYDSLYFNLVPQILDLAYQKFFE